MDMRALTQITAQYIYIHTISESFVERESRGDNMMGGGTTKVHQKSVDITKTEKKMKNITQSWYVYMYWEKKRVYCLCVDLSCICCSTHICDDDRPSHIEDHNNSSCSFCCPCRFRLYPYRLPLFLQRTSYNYMYRQYTHTHTHT